jgi:hypothetical protein
MPLSLSERLAALKDDGFIDFYELLDVETDATVTRIRSTINTLYNEAQSNRDHRNLNRRREYQTLLQVLPQAREMLLEEGNRSRYDAFREEVARGATSISFEDWARGLGEEKDAGSGSSSVLGVNETDRPAEGTHVATASVKKVPPKPAPRVVVEGQRTPSAAPARASLMGSLISIIIFFALFLILYYVAGLEVPISILISCIAAIVAWFISHSKRSRRTPV